MVNSVWGSMRVCVWCVLVVLFGAARAHAEAVTLGWDVSTSPDVAGYILMWGTSPRQYTREADVAQNTSYTIPDLPNGVYYFTVRAYGTDGALSPSSNEVIVALGVPMPSACTTPDPFAMAGGGTCYDGGWLAPGMAPPSGNTAAAPAPSSPPPSGACTTADPFASMGGGTCYNGGWLPPGVPVPGTVTAPSAPAPAPSPAPSVQGCSTSDPFAAMGGGTCYNGGWLPPGVPVPGAVTTPSTPVPAPAPVAASTPTVQGCSAPDPFASMGGGTCYNGGWLPPGMTPPAGVVTTAPPAPTAPAAPQLSVCATPDPFAALGGGICYGNSWLPPGMEIVVNGTMKLLSDGWQILGDDGVIYRSPTAIAPKYLLDQAKVTFRGRTLPSPPGVSIVQILSIAFR